MAWSVVNRWRRLCAVAAISIVLAPTLASASYYAPVHQRAQSRDYDLPPPNRSARITVTADRLRVWVDGREIAVDNAWLKALPGISLYSALLVRASDAPELFVLIECGPRASGQAMLRIRHGAAERQSADGCKGEDVAEEGSR